MNRILLSIKKKRRRKKEDIIREGDIVKIIEPYEFIRCGYPLTLKDASKLLKENDSYNQLRIEFIKLLYKKERESSDGPLTTFAFSDTKFKHQIKNDIESILAKIYLYEHNYGGNKRTLHTVYRKSLLNVRAKVKKIRYHKTGTYVPKWSSVSYEGEYDYEPAYLSNEQTHKILFVELLEDGGREEGVVLNSFLSVSWCGHTYWIEDTNVIKLTEDC
jgi:hypothetical protein